MIEAMRHLSEAEMRAVAGALRAGRLFAPYTAVSLGRYCPSDRAAGIAAAMQRLADEGMQQAHLALVIDACLSSRGSGPAAESVDLVWTGPDTNGTTSRDTGVVVRELFGSATRSILVAGFAVYQGRDVFRVLAARMEQLAELQVRMFLDIRRPQGDTSSEAEILRRFVHRFRKDEWPGSRFPEVFYDSRSLSLEATKRSSLHAKCVVVDRRVAFVSSANFTEAAQVRNIEVGALIRSERFALRLTEQFASLLAGGLLEQLYLPQPV